MKSRYLAIVAAMAFAGSIIAAQAQSAEPTYKGDPSVYKIIFEDANFRVVESVRKPGVHDKAHSHPASVRYSVNGCKTKLHMPDATTREFVSEAGKAYAVPEISSHSAENIGTDDCKEIFVEKK